MIDGLILFFQIFGAVSFVGVILILFSNIGDRPRRYKTTSDLFVEDPDFLSMISRTVHASLEMGGKVEILNNGEFFDQLFAACKTAKRHIHIAVYIWQEGKVANKLLEIFKKKLAEGVEVRLLVDSFGAGTSLMDEFAALEQHGAKIIRFRTFRIGKLSRAHRRNHRRAIIIDGSLGFTGGMAMKDAWLGNASNPKEWRDMMFRLTGPMARSLQSAFADVWANASGEVLTGEEYYPSKFRNFQDIPNIPFIHLVSSPSPDTQPIPLFWWLSLMAAQKSIYLTTPYFIPDKHELLALGRQALKGLDVRLILPGENIDASPIRWVSHKYYDTLLRAGVKIYEYEPTFIHSKYIVIDGIWSIIGSANFNNRSADLDEENIFGIQDQKLGGELVQTFFEDLKHAREIKLEDWKKRSIFIKLNEWFWWLFAKQF